MVTTTLKQFYREIFGDEQLELDSLLDIRSQGDIGHFNVFNILEVNRLVAEKAPMPYNRRNYYKISLIKGRNRVEYADKVFQIEDQAVLFASPRIPYSYQPLGQEQSGHFCVFTGDFLATSKTGLAIDQLPLFSTEGDFVYQISAEQFAELHELFGKMHREIQSDYPYKYDLLRNYTMELIHYGQKLQPLPAGAGTANASSRIASLFIELLERQFPIESPSQSLQLRTAKDYADTLSIHVNHLNKVLKEVAGKTTTEVIKGRVNQEAKFLLKQTNWSVSEIAHCLGFEEVAHFSNFFKRNSRLSPTTYRN